jgi:hypothetical protein
LPTPIASEYFYTRTIGEIVISASKSYAGDFAVASLISNPLRNAIGGQLGVANNGYTKSTMAQGRAKHDLYKVNDIDINADKIKEYRDIKGMRPDFVDIPNKTVYELKPNNPRSIARGKKQLDRYSLST